MPARYLILPVLLGLAFGGGIYWERRAYEGQAVRLEQLEKDLELRNAQLEALRDDQAKKGEAHEDAARADPDNVRRGIGPAGLRRLENLWGE